MKKTFASPLLVLGLLLLVFGALLTSSCREDFVFTPSTGELAFSKDTLFLDTIFTGISSSTYNFKVYNTSNQDILIPSIRLGQGSSSQYRLNVDGVAGQEFQNIPLLANAILDVL